ncbi:hypothetical protein O6H91_16G066300 [Diphasiastrum complanatum]|uniref:Uncharacterized protein n=1 Tax=Diphasiastrum complanatum TaxID=34168 RepID=A0ACC2BD21_DIPCM|nr:hypothetical protein O6H91_16G066300 [Diphasiastrum complanatum]
MESWTGGKEMETDIVDALNNPQWPKAEVALGHGIWWKGIFNSKIFNTDKATLAVLYATVPLSYSDFHTAQYDAKALAACISLLPSAVVEAPEDSNLESACHRLRNQISSAFSTLAYPRQYGQYTHKAVGLGRRALTVDEFTKLFAGGVSMRYEGKSQTQLTETYAGYSLKALGTNEYLMLQGVADNPDYKEQELWCLTRPNAINLALGRNCEGERVNYPLQLPSWNSANNMYPCLGIFVAGDAGVVAYPSNLQKRNALPSVFFGECVFSNLLHEHYESSIFDAAIVDSAGASVEVQDAALMWQRVYASELSLESGACIARRQADPRKCEPLMMPISVFSKEVLPNIFCVETLCVARELKLAGNEGYEFDCSSWPFLFNTPHNMLMMLEAVGNKGDSCKAIGESMATEVSVRGKAKAMLNCLAPLYSYLEGKIRNDVEQQPVEYYGDTALWATLNALAPLEFTYSKKPDVCFKNSVIISNAVKKASSCVALLENMKRDLDNNTLDTGIEKFLAHSSVQLSMVETSTPHLFRDSTLGILARNYVRSEVHTAQLNIRWANIRKICKYHHNRHSRKRHNWGSFSCGRFREPPSAAASADGN